MIIYYDGSLKLSKPIDPGELSDVKQFIKECAVDTCITDLTWRINYVPGISCEIQFDSTPLRTNPKWFVSQINMILGEQDCRIKPGSILKFFGDEEGAILVTCSEYEILDNESAVLWFADRDKIRNVLRKKEEVEGILRLDLREYIENEIIDRHANDSQWATLLDVAGFTKDAILDCAMDWLINSQNHCY